MQIYRFSLPALLLFASISTAELAHFCPNPSQASTSTPQIPYFIQQISIP